MRAKRFQSRQLRTIALVAGSLVLSALAPGVASAKAMPCADVLKRAPADIEVLAARTVTGRLPAAEEVKARGPANAQVNPYLLDLPAFCRVNAILKPVPRSRIEIELWLPAKWNGKLLGIGSHGFGGNFERGDMAMALHRGYAVVTSDLGHSSRDSARQGGFNVGDARFAIGNDTAVDDFAWRATHQMTVAAKALVKRFYGTAARRSYFDGCSNGGRQAMREAQQFPKDYDGILAGSAAIDWTRSFAATASYFQAGMLPSGRKFDPAKLQLAQNAAIKACDTLDGAADNLLVDPRKCGWKASELLCRPGQDASTCLTGEEAAAIDRIHRPIVDSRTGALVYDGLVAGSEASWRNMFTFNAVTANFFRFMVMDDATWTPTADTDLFALLARSEMPGAPGVRINSTDPDLSAFRAGGGKLIQYHGWVDPSFAPSDATNYYEEVVDLQDGPDKLARTQAFYRLFMVPGMAHCYGGQGPINFGALDHEPSPVPDADHDILAALDRWVEKGVAPKRIVATEFADDRTVKRQMPLCPYPKFAIYRAGDIAKPESYVCRASK